MKCHAYKKYHRQFEFYRFSVQIPHVPSKFFAAEENVFLAFGVF